MLVIPIINEERILNVSLRLRTAKQIENKTAFLDSNASDIIINKKSFKDSSYYKKQIEPKVIVDFIHHNNMYADSKEFYVTTKRESNSNKYSVYEIDIPTLKVTDGLNNLFGECIIDLCNENKNLKKGRNISLRKYNIAGHITNERLDKLKYLADNLDTINPAEYIKKEGLQDLIDTIEFLDLFDCTVISKSTINCENIELIMNSLEKTSTNLSKELNKYYEMALENANIYSKLSKLYHIVYNKPYKWIHKNVKIKQKIKDVSGDNKDNE